MYNILVESLQNIYHHMDELRQESGDTDSGMQDAMFLIVRGDDGVYYIHTGNFIQNDKCELLQARIDQINNMSAEELRMHYVDPLIQLNCLIKEEQARYN
ncbi:MAG: hypothetical protein IPP71_13140 [Bacteroidetes bacterium]|nr:hypothetical protein [Bacteroidota bacterium]